PVPPASEGGVPPEAPPPPPAAAERTHGRTALLPDHSRGAADRGLRGRGHPARRLPLGDAQPADGRRRGADATARRGPGAAPLRRGSARPLALRGAPGRPPGRRRPPPPARRRLPVTPDGETPPPTAPATGSVDPLRTELLPEEEPVVTGTLFLTVIIL